MPISHKSCLKNLLKKLLEQEYDLVMDDGEMEVLESMCTFSQGVKAIARREGLREGRKEGRREGRKEENNYIFKNRQSKFGY